MTEKERKTSETLLNFPRKSDNIDLIRKRFLFLEIYENVFVSRKIWTARD